jgi:hypothetical protein
MNELNKAPVRPALYNDLVEDYLHDLRESAVTNMFGASPAYFSPSWTAFQADRGRDFSVIVDGISN